MCKAESASGSRWRDNTGLDPGGLSGHTKELGFYSRCNAKALEAFKPENFQMLRGLLYCSEHGLEGVGVEGWVITRAAFALVRGERLFIEL